MNKAQQIGILLILIGGFFVYWAYTHSPNAALGQKIGNMVSGSYTMSPTGYYASMAAGLLLVVWGIMRFIKGK